MCLDASFYKCVAACTKYIIIMVLQIFELHWKMHAARIKLRSHCTRSYQMEQIDIKVAQEVDVVLS